MAETQILTNSNLQITPGSCASCVHAETAGQNQGVNGNFSDYLNGSLKQSLNTSARDGEALPVSGKNLPQPILPAEIKDHEFKLQSLLNDFQVDDIDPNILIGTLRETIDTSFDNHLVDFQAQLDGVSDAETISQGLLSQLDLSNRSKLLQDVIPSQLENVNEFAAKTLDEVSGNTITAIQTNTASATPAQVEYINLAANLNDYQQGLIARTQIKDVELQQSIGSNFEIENEDLVTFAAVQKASANENQSEKLNDFVTRYLSEDSVFKTTYKNPTTSIDIFQQNINTIKPEQVSQNINLGSVVDAYSNQHTAGLQSKSIEAPIPLIIKQSAGLEQAQSNVDQSITQNIKWLVNNNTQNAKISVFPESLGQVNIALNLEDSNLKINFIASSNITRDLIEASVTNLRNHFNESGINLQEVNVETRFSSQADQESQYSDLQNQVLGHQGEGSNFFSQEDDALELHEPANISIPLYLLDAYA